MYLMLFSNIQLIFWYPIVHADDLKWTKACDSLN